MSEHDPDVLTVSELAYALKDTVNAEFPGVWVRGELSNFRPRGTGHWYFTLKDGRAQISVAMFARENRRVRFGPKDGDEVLLHGRVDVYPQRGSLQLVADRMDALGLGRLQAQFEKLKARLQAEGLFDRARKRPLPRVPRRIGIVTSQHAAALQDMLRILHQRDPTLSVLIAPCKVQGAGAARSIAEALDLLGGSGRVEVILCGRGGGSLEDLWAFNEEEVARAIARCPVPVVSGVGHEIDFTIADFTADARAPTPTAAAEMAVPIRVELEAATADLRARAAAAQQRALRLRRSRLDELRGRLRGPRRLLDDMQQRLDDARTRLLQALERSAGTGRERSAALRARLLAAAPTRELARGRDRVEAARTRLTTAATQGLLSRRAELEGARRALLALGPLGTLDRGWAIAVRDDDGVLTDASDVRPGDGLRLRLRRGALHCRVESVTGSGVDLLGRPTPEGSA